MTDRERKMIEGYLPSPRDPDLGPFEYYVLDNRDRPVRVTVSHIGYDRDQAIFQVFTPSGKLVHGPYETSQDLWGGGWYYKGSLYDNKDDCRSCTHSWCHFWEDLRRMQEEEGQA